MGIMLVLHEIVNGVVGPPRGFASIIQQLLLDTLDPTLAHGCSRRFAQRPTIIILANFQSICG
jgi:hypothetical protein